MIKDFGTGSGFGTTESVVFAVVTLESESVTFSFSFEFLIP